MILLQWLFWILFIYIMFLFVFPSQTAIMTILLVGAVASCTGCATQVKPAERVNIAVPVEVKVVAPPRPSLALATISYEDSAGKRLEKYDQTIEALMGYSMQLECLLRPFATNPEQLRCADP